MFSDKKIVLALVLAGALAVGSIVLYIGDVSSVREWVVSVATATGEFVSEKAEFLHEAIVSTFFRIKIHDGVEFDRDDPLVGRCVVDRFMEFKAEHLGVETRLNLKNKKMRRSDEMSPWFLDYEALPQELKKYCESFNPGHLAAN